MSNLKKIESKWSSELDIIEQKLLLKLPLTFQYKMRIFTLPPYIKCDNIELLLQKHVDKCIICNNICCTTNEYHFVNCKSCNVFHRTKLEFFVICDNCVNFCVNVKIKLIRTIYSCGNNWFLASVCEVNENNYVRRCDSVISIINNIISKDGIIDKYYNFDSKCTLLLIMSYYDSNSLLIKIPKDIIKYMCVNFIYYDKL